MRHQDDEEARFDLLQVGDEVMAYWSPDKQFYLAMVIELETKKMARQDNPIKAVKRRLSLDYLEEAVNVEAKKIASKKKMSSVASAKAMERDIVLGSSTEDELDNDMIRNRASS